jgi:hypothetical protein
LKIIQACPTSDSTCQGNNAWAAVQNIYSVAATTVNPQTWELYTISSSIFALKYRGFTNCVNGQASGCCLDQCGGATCGQAQNNGKARVCAGREGEGVFAAPCYIATPLAASKVSAARDTPRHAHGALCFVYANHCDG